MGRSWVDRFRQEVTMAPVTTAIALICFAVDLFIAYYWALSANTDPTALFIRLGANYGPLVRHGEWWRLVTSTFMHAGTYHLLLNIGCLLSLGPVVERMLGKWMFCLSYLVTGIAAGLVSLAVHPNTPSVGASGAIFGLAGILIAYRVLWRVSFGVFRISASFLALAIFIAANLFLGAVLPFVDNAAHLGGLLSGLLLGFLIWVFTPTRQLAAPQQN
jgi:rhomboid protease GluP